MLGCVEQLWASPQRLRFPPPHKMALSKGKGVLSEFPLQCLKGLSITHWRTAKSPLPSGGTLHKWHSAEEGWGHAAAPCRWLVDLGAVVWMCFPFDSRAQAGSPLPTFLPERGEVSRPGGSHRFMEIQICIWNTLIFKSCLKPSPTLQASINNQWPRYIPQIPRLQLLSYIFILAWGLEACLI